jgi:phosphoribosylformylglycinamidine (FGAM) synthase-like enzyme
LIFAKDLPLLQNFDLIKSLIQRGIRYYEPQYHPERQPIEICWAIVKNYMADHCNFTIENFRMEIPNAFEQVKPSTCKKLISKVAKQYFAP